MPDWPAATATAPSTTLPPWWRRGAIRNPIAVAADPWLGPNRDRCPTQRHSRQLVRWKTRPLHRPPPRQHRQHDRWRTDHDDFDGAGAHLPVATFPYYYPAFSCL